MNCIFRSMLIVSLFCLVSCSNPADPPLPGTGITEADRQAAQDSGAAAVIDAASHEFALTWTDLFSDEEGFGIEKQTSGTWQRLQTLPPTEGVGSSVSWTGTFSEPDQYRVVADKAAYSLPLHTVAGGTDFSVAIPDTVPVLVLDTNEPLTGPVTISLADAGSVNSVDYFVDLAATGSVSAGPGFSYVWDPASVANGVHLLSALAWTSDGVSLELKLQIQVETPDLVVHQNLVGSSGIVALDVSATADIGIESVESFLDDSSLGLLTSPNNETLFRWSIDTRELTAGLHTIRSVAIDREGNSRASVITPEFDQPPVLTLSSPVSGSFVSDSVVLNGEFTDDTEGTTISAWFGDLPILTTTDSPFSAQYDLLGTVPGTYSLRVRAVDSANHMVEESRTVVVESADAMTGVLVQSNATLLAAGNGYSLLRSPEGFISVRSPGGSIVQLPDTESIDHATTWQLCNGRAVVSGQLNGYPNPTQVFLYDLDGQRRNLSEEVESAGYYDVHPVTQWPWVAWSSQWENSNNGYGGTHDLDVYHILNLQTEELFEVAKPAGVGTLGNNSYDLAVIGGGVVFYYWAENSTGFDIYSYSTITETSTRVSTTGSNVRVASDGQRVAWEHGDVTFMLGSVENPENAQPITENGSAFLLDGGIFAWKESDGVSSAIKAHDGQEVTLSLYDSSILAGVGAGYVAFRESGHLYVWDRLNGTRLVSAVGVAEVEIDGNFLYANMPGLTVYVYDLD